MTSILIIEDNMQFRQLIKGEVCDLAERMYEGCDGSEAVTLYRQHQPEWVFMDLEMKEMDGLTATRQLKAVFPQARICIVTNYDDEYLREEAMAAGACAYVVKENLLEVRQVLQQSIS